MSNVPGEVAFCSGSGARRLPSMTSPWDAAHTYVSGAGNAWTASSHRIIRLFFSDLPLSKVTTGKRASVPSNGHRVVAHGPLIYQKIGCVRNAGARLDSLPTTELNTARSTHRSEASTMVVMCAASRANWATRSWVCLSRA